jgi:hypothetical protein
MSQIVACISKIIKFYFFLIKLSFKAQILLFFLDVMYYFNNGRKVHKYKKSKADLLWKLDQCS